MCSVQGPVGRHVVDGLVLATQVPAWRRADDEVPRPWRENQMGKLCNAVGVIRRQCPLMNSFVTEIFKSVNAEWIAVDVAVRKSARGPGDLTAPPLFPDRDDV